MCITRGPQAVRDFAKRAILALSTAALLPCFPAVAGDATMAEPTTGCKSREVVAEALMLIAKGDKEAAGVVLMRSSCHLFQTGDVVSVEDENYLPTNPSIPGECLRPHGDPDCYWTWMAKTVAIDVAQPLHRAGNPPQQTIQAPPPQQTIRAPPPAGQLEDGLTASARGDFAEAMRLLRPLAEQGDPYAQAGIGLLYGNGRGVPKDYGQALAWFRKAAEQGYEAAQNDLGVMYALGQGAPQDYVQAYMWFDLAASRASDAENRDKAVKNRDEAASKMTRDQIAEGSG